MPIILASETFSEKKEYKALFAWFCTVHDKCNAKKNNQVEIAPD